MIEIRQSSIKNAGYGVWATQDIKEDTALTEYFGEKIKTSAYEKLHALWENDFASLSDGDLEILSSDAVLTFSDFHIVGKKQYSDISKCGQIINDYSRLKSFSDQHIDEYEKSFSLCNVYPLLKDNIILMFASRNIKKGEELFFHYGIKYWESVIKNEDPKGFLKFNIFESIANKIKYAKIFHNS